MNGLKDQTGRDLVLGARVVWAGSDYSDFIRRSVVRSGTVVLIDWRGGDPAVVVEPTERTKPLVIRAPNDLVVTG